MIYPKKGILPGAGGDIPCEERALGAQAPLFPAGCLFNAMAGDRKHEWDACSLLQEV